METKTFPQACLYLDNFRNAVSTLNKENSEKKWNWIIEDWGKAFGETKFKKCYVMLYCGDEWWTINSACS